jgi:hypothetical protein
MRQIKFIAAALSASLAVGSLALVNSAAHAKDDPSNDTRRERMQHDKWTNADRARDALDHLKKAREELDNIANDKKSGQAADALKDVKTAIDHVDKYIEAVDEKAKK